MHMGSAYLKLHHMYIELSYIDQYALIWNSHYVIKCQEYHCCDFEL